MRSVAVLGILAASIVWVGGCAHYGRRPTSALEQPGSCDGACAHYSECRGDDDGALESLCLAECQGIFVTDGVTDGETLREFEELDCPDAVAFIEGEAGRPPGSPPRTTAAASTPPSRSR